MKIFVETLGCSKNLVDSENMMGILKKHGCEFVGEKEDADLVIINTCGFIESAKQEAIDTIIEAGLVKEQIADQKILVTGCLGERYSDELLVELPEIDAVIGTNDYANIIDIVEKMQKNERFSKSEKAQKEYIEIDERVVTTSSYMAYLKIAEGCSNNCSYCSIPQIRGPYRSRKIENIYKEANTLAENGVKELVVIAQDITRYGKDKYGKYMLAELLKELTGIQGFEWIRLMYLYPDVITDELIDVMANNEKICRYIDLPIQHCNDEILSKMNRRIDKKGIVEVIGKLRAKIKDIHIRTSIIVGFPGETESDFEELKDFVQEMRFDRLGVFAYSQEEGTPAAIMTDQIDEEVKQERYNELMSLQKEIALSNNAKKIDATLRVLVEEILEDEDLYVGRTEFDAFEIDNSVIFKSEKPCDVGEFVDVKITEAYEYDLIGEIVDESCE